MGRWSRLAAFEFLQWIRPQPKLRWLEIGCGTGALTEAVLENAYPGSILACDPSEALVGVARNRIRDPRASFQIAGAEDLPVQPAEFDILASGLVLNFIEDPETAIGSLKGLLSKHGLVASYVWDYSQGIEFLRAFWDVAVAQRPDAANLDEGRRFPICAPEPLRSLFQRLGLKKVEVVDLNMNTQFDSFEDYWEPLLGGTGPAPSYVSSLEDAERDRLEQGLRARLSPNGEGRIMLKARAWAVRGFI
jgi:ubiquinone/menaquinone biosynthesis C-methylase UbiE